MTRTSPPGDAGPVDAPHAAPAEDVLAGLSVDADVGLSGEEVRRRRRAHGRNELGGDAEVSWLRLLWNQLASAVVVLLLGAGVVGLLVGEVIEAGAILVVLVVNAIVGFATELQAARSMAALRQLMGTIAEVERDDRRDEIDAAGLVPGDIVGIEAGEQVPADLRLLEAEGLQVEEAGLTGESEAVTKSVEPVAEEASLGDRTNMAYLGTTVLAGRGRGVVVATGRATQMGQIADLAGSAEQSRAPLQQGLDELSRRLAVGVVGGAAALFGLGLLRGREVAEMAETAVALAIAVVPEGLPAVATLTLAVGMRRMARGNALVRRLPAVETLGSTTVVCSDKTGTLTRNEMEVVEVVLADGADPEALWRVAVLCNDADVDLDGDPVGDPTEVALLQGAGEHGLDWRALRESTAREHEVPFDSEAKRMAVVVDGEVLAKGAPEALLDDEAQTPLAGAAARMAGQALRTLAMAHGPAPHGEVDDDALFVGLAPLGVVGMQDPPRDAAAAAVATLRTAGIRVVMITGDRADTAAAIARQLGIDEPEAVTGEALNQVSAEELERLAAGTDVFARVDPEHKLRIIEALQSVGEVVAVTGDGVNDAPALSQANVGVAMGSGTDVARDAADVVLLDDRFETLEVAVEEGRRIFANIQRFGQFLFSWHVAEVAVITTAVLAGLPPPLAGLMILWNNLVIDVLPSFALALEPSRQDVMREAPRDPRQPVIDRGVLRRIGASALLVAAVGLAAYGLATSWLGLGTAAAQTTTFVAMSLGQVLTVFNARRETGSGFRGASRNRWLWAALAITFALEAVALSVPALRDILGLTSLPGPAWGVALALGVVPVAAVQSARILRARRSGAPEDTASTTPAGGG
ncbi:MAG: cation-translocating P-type ATPase [Actinomycetota bacterium]